MNRWPILACFALAVVHIPGPTWAQFTDPRTYVNSPIGINQMEVSYTYVHANASVDTSLIITGAKLNLNQGITDYTRYFSLLHRLTWLQAGITIAGLSGSINGTSINGSVAGTGDSFFQLATLLSGGPALSVKEFENYKPSTTLGMSLTVTAPTGLYRSSRVLNLGSDRWSFKPEIGLSRPFGSKQEWEFDAHANVFFYTDNTSYHGTEILRQQPLPGIEGHISYSFSDKLWASLDTRYSFRGSTVVNGASQDNPQQNFILGSEMNIALNPRHSLTFEIAKALVHRNGPALSGFNVRYDYTWGKNYR